MSTSASVDSRPVTNRWAARPQPTTTIFLVIADPFGRSATRWSHDGRLTFPVRFRSVSADVLPGAPSEAPPEAPIRGHGVESRTGTGTKHLDQRQWRAWPS